MNNGIFFDFMMDTSRKGLNPVSESLFSFSLLLRRTKKRNYATEIKICLFPDPACMLMKLRVGPMVAFLFILCLFLFV